MKVRKQRCECRLERAEPKANLGQAKPVTSNYVFL